jgi:hypothetical protein
LLVASLLAASTGFARAQFLCRMSGQIGRACCCSRHTERAPAGTAEVRQTDCCQTVIAKSADRVVAEPPPGVEVPPAAGAFVPFEVAPAAPRAALVRLTPNRSRGPPLHGPPLYIKHCTLLG